MGVKKVDTGWFIYRFLDKKGEIVYVGKTVDLDRRMKQHFTNGHLEKFQYEEVDSIEYMDLETESDLLITEIFLINRHKPKFNTSDKKQDTLTLKMNIKEEWLRLEGVTKESVYYENEKLKNEVKRLKRNIEGKEEKLINLIINNNRTNKINDSQNFLIESWEKKATEKSALLENLYTQGFSNVRCRKCNTLLKTQENNKGTYFCESCNDFISEKNVIRTRN